MKRLIIIGAGGFGREVLGYAEDIRCNSDCKWTIGGFIDDNNKALDGYDVEYPIIGSIKDYVPKENDLFICAFGDSDRRLGIGRTFQNRGAVFTNLIHPSAIILKRTVIGTGAIISMNALIANDSICGDFLYMNFGSFIGHDNVIGDGCTLNSYCGTNGTCKLGSRVYMGVHSVIIPGKKVGNDVKICAGAIVFNNIKDGHTVYGNPARNLK